MLNMRELQGQRFGEDKDKEKAKSAMRDLEGLLSGGGGPSTLADIDEQWRQVQQGKRQQKSRMSTVHVAGVGKVDVLNENDYAMGEDMPNAATAGGDAGLKHGRQVPPPSLPSTPPALRMPWPSAWHAMRLQPRGREPATLTLT